MSQLIFGILSQFLVTFSHSCYGGGRRTNLPAGTQIALFARQWFYGIMRKMSGVAKIYNSWNSMKEHQEIPTGAKNSLHAEHLKDGVRPIMACVGMPEQFSETLGPEKKLLEYDDQRLLQEGIRNVDYFGEPQELERENYKNAGDYSYAISPVDDTDKFSREFRNCTGLAVIGTDKESGASVSFFSHQDPNHFLSGTKNTEHFTHDVRQRLSELKGRCVEGTIDAVIVGGNVLFDRPLFKEGYINSIKLLAGQVEDVLGFEPVVIIGPKATPGSDNVFFDTKQRRLYIMRPQVGNETTQSFLPSDLDKQQQKW